VVSRNALSASCLPACSLLAPAQLRGCRKAWVQSAPPAPAAQLPPVARAPAHPAASLAAVGLRASTASWRPAPVRHGAEGAVGKAFRGLSAPLSTTATVRCSGSAGGFGLRVRGEEERRLPGAAVRWKTTSCAGGLGRYVPLGRPQTTRQPRLQASDASPSHCRVGGGAQRGDRRLRPRRLHRRRVTGPTVALVVLVSPARLLCVSPPLAPRLLTAAWPVCCRHLRWEGESAAPPV
jgi:hypothetical protein